MSAFGTLLLTLSPSLYWTLDSVTGVTDQSGNGRNGTASGPTIGADASEPLIDGTGGSTDLDGVDDRITSTYVVFTVGATRTYGGWAYRDTTGTLDTLVGATTGNSTNRRPFFPIGTDASPAGMQIDPDEGIGGIGTWADVWTELQWVFWVIVHNDTALTAELFLNGASVGTVSALNPLSAANTTMQYQLGMHRSTLNPYDGKLAHAFVVESALTAQNVADLYTAATVLSRPLSVTRANVRFA